MIALRIGGIKHPGQARCFEVPALRSVRHSAAMPTATTSEAHSQAASRPLAIEATSKHRTFGVMASELRRQGGSVYRWRYALESDRTCSQEK